MRTTTPRSIALTPGVVGFLASSRVRAHRVAAFRVLQRLDPVHRSPLGVTVLSRHADVDRLLRNPTLSSSERRADLSLLRVGGLNRLLGATARDPDDDAFEELFASVLLFQDPPDHTRLRTLVAKAFTPRRVEALAPRIEALAEELLGDLLRSPAPELLHDFAYPFPARVVCELLGVPDDGVGLFVEHAPALAIGLDPSPMRTSDGVRRAGVATRELRRYLTALIAVRRRDPADDLLSALVHAEADGATLSEDELVALVLLLVVAGHETTANVIGSTTLRLLRDPALRRRVATLDDAGLRVAVEEDRKSVV
jgi:cytochrome P450